ncbi:MAG: twin-arginine translocase TatA/TatE family subunit [Actinobacteria bacterium]|nr:twin-arginine translocase TatA/TatE family subunit [Actinomycetota bacterium]
MFGLKGQELLIILLIVLLVFGARKLPDLARSLGASAKEFRKGIEDGTEEASDEARDVAPDVAPDIKAADTQTSEAPPPDKPASDT